MLSAGSMSLGCSCASHGKIKAKRNRVYSQEAQITKRMETTLLPVDKLLLTVLFYPIFITLLFRHSIRVVILTIFSIWKYSILTFNCFCWCQWRDELAFSCGRTCMVLMCFRYTSCRGRHLFLIGEFKLFISLVMSDLFICSCPVMFIIFDLSLLFLLDHLLFH